MTKLNQNIVSLIAVLVIMLTGAGASQAQNASSAAPTVLVGTQYDTTHVYDAPDKIDAFVSSFAATFGGHATQPVVMNVLPVPSSTIFRAALTPAGNLSVFAFTTPIPLPFGEERNGFLVTDMDQAVASAKSAGADVIVQPFRDPIGRDAVVEWPGGLKMQFYWHFKAPSSAPLAAVPESRVYVSSDKADELVRDLSTFAQGTVIADDKTADATEIGRPSETFRRINLQSGFGQTVLFVTDGHLPYPFGYDITGYQVADLAATLAKAKATGASVLSSAVNANGRSSAIIQFPGGYIAEVHELTAN